MTDNYLQIMTESLEKKEHVLDEIVKLSEEQENILAVPNLDPDDFQKYVNKKAEWIDQLELLDEGFEGLYEKVKDILSGDKSLYAVEIRQMQELIKRITDKSVKIQAIEARNKRLTEQKFGTVRKQVREVRNSQKIVQQYYKNMVRNAGNEPYFVDNKK